MSVLPAVTDRSAPVALLELTQGAVITQALYVAARLGIADVLRDGPLSATEIADEVGADPEAVSRLLRLLCGYSVFTADDHGRFDLTPVGDALRENAPDSMRGMALLMGHSLLWEEWEHLFTTVRTGEANLPKLRGTSAFEYLMGNPEYGLAFFRGMGCLSGIETEPVVSSYDFSRFGTIIDVGGGSGGLLAEVLKSAPGSAGVLFDAPHATGAAGQVLQQADVTDRCTVQNGSYFESVPDGGHAYLLKHTLHDFTEDQCLAVLRNIRKAIRPDGVLLVIEYVLGGEDTRHIGNVIDMWLMLMLGAKERTSGQYAELLSAAGFRLTRIVPTSSPVSLVEAVPC